MQKIRKKTKSSICLCKRYRDVQIFKIHGILKEDKKPYNQYTALNFYFPIIQVSDIIPRKLIVIAKSLWIFVNLVTVSLMFPTAPVQPIQLFLAEAPKIWLYMNYNAIK